MFSLIRRLTAVGGVVAFARSPMGQRLLAKGKDLYSDPRTQQRIGDLRRKYLPSRNTERDV